MKLNLGCGPKWKEQYPEHQGLDVIDYGQKFKGDIFTIFPSLYKEDFWDEVMANHFLEHFTQDQLKKIFKKMWKILKPGGVFKFVVPHKGKASAWDLTHKTFWNKNTVTSIEVLKGFGKWKVEEVVVNARKDIHAKLKKI